MSHILGRLACHLPNKQIELVKMRRQFEAEETAFLHVLIQRWNETIWAKTYCYFFCQQSELLFRSPNDQMRSCESLNTSQNTIVCSKKSSRPEPEINTNNIKGWRTLALRDSSVWIGDDSMVMRSVCWSIGEPLIPCNTPTWGESANRLPRIMKVIVSKMLLWQVVGCGKTYFTICPITCNSRAEIECDQTSEISAVLSHHWGHTQPCNHFV